MSPGGVPRPPAEGPVRASGKPDTRSHTSAAPVTLDWSKAQMTLRPQRCCSCELFTCLVNPETGVHQHKACAELEAAS